MWEAAETHVPITNTKIPRWKAVLPAVLVVLSVEDLLLVLLGGDVALIPGSIRSPGGGNGNPLQYSCLENPMDSGAWLATVHGVTKESDMTEVTQHTCRGKRKCYLFKGRGEG